MKIFAVILLCFSSFFTFAQQMCISNAIPTADSNQFVEADNGLTTLHIATGLIWMRCSLGQTYDSENNVCTGEAEKYTWQQALAIAHAYEFDNSVAWRLPNIKEMSLLAERTCVRPSIDEQIFPNTPPDDFWTSTPSITDERRAWVIAFFNSSNSIKEKDRSIFVRLVRNLNTNKVIDN